MNLSCWGIKIRHPLWLLRWQGSLHQLIFLRDQKMAPPLTYMWCNIWYMCYVLLYTSATSDSDAEQRRGCSEHVWSTSSMLSWGRLCHPRGWTKSKDCFVWISARWSWEDGNCRKYGAFQEVMGVPLTIAGWFMYFIHQWVITRGTPMTFFSDTSP